jgi:hypothetical protein
MSTLNSKIALTTGQVSGQCYRIGPQDRLACRFGVICEVKSFQTAMHTAQLTGWPECEVPQLSVVGVVEGAAQFGPLLDRLCNHHERQRFYLLAIYPIAYEGSP